MLYRTHGRLAYLVGLALAAGGCSNAPSGGGFTNGEPLLLKSSEKAAIRSDLPTPVARPGEESLADGAASSVQAGPTNAGSGGRNAGQGGTSGNESASPSSSASNEVRDTPPKLETPHGASAAGATKPSGKIEVGTPKSPQ